MTQILRIGFVLLGAAMAWGADAPALAIVEKAAGHVGFYSEAGQQLKAVSVGRHPHEMVFSADGRYLFTTDNGVLLMTEKTEGENTVSIVDVRKQEKVGVVDLGPHRRPHGIDFDSATGHVLVTTELPSALLIIDPALRKVIDVYEVGGKAPHMVRLGPDHRTAWVTCTDTNSVSAIDLKTRAVRTLPADGRPQGIEFSPDRSRLYVANSDGHAITVIDVAERKVAGQIPVGSGHSGPVRVAVAADGKTVLAALQLDHAISFANTVTMKEEKVIPLPGPPVSMTLSADRKTAWCAVQEQDTVYVISVPGRRIVRSFRTPAQAGPDPVLPLP